MKNSDNDYQSPLITDMQSKEDLESCDVWKTRICLLETMTIMITNIDNDYKDKF